MHSTILPPRFAQAIVALMLLLMLSGCGFKVRFTAKYDALLDQAVHNLESRTNTHLQRIIDHKGIDSGSHTATQEFYAEAKGEVQSLRVRAETLEEGLKATPLSDNFKALHEQYVDLELLHRMPYNTTLIDSARRAFDQSFRAIVKHLVYLKWNQSAAPSEQ